MKLMKTILIIFILIFIYRYICKYINTNNSNNTIYVDKPYYDIIEIPKFLTYEECDKIIKLSKGKPKDNLVDNKTRISEQCWLKDNDPFIKNLSDKIKSYTNTHTNYKPGGFFKPHYDDCVGNKADCERLNKYGIRYLTVLFYLNDSNFICFKHLIL